MNYSIVFRILLTTLINSALLSTYHFKVTAQTDNVIDDCPNGEKLALNFINETVHPIAKCADGTQPGFYLGRDNADIEDLFLPNRSFVIWLGDTNTCAGQACTDLCQGSQREVLGTGLCENVTANLQELNETDQETATCLYSRATCTSAWWDTFPTVAASTIMCQEDPLFGEDVRVFLPSCSLDYWLGKETEDTVPQGSFSRELFRGGHIFRAIIQTLAEEENLAFAPRIVFGGTRGAGIGVLHLANVLRQILSDFLDTVEDQLTTPKVVPEIYLVVDSAWFVSVEKFAPTEEERGNASSLYTLDEALRVNTSEWIERAELLPSCKDKFPVEEMYKCLFSSEVTQFHLNNPVNGNESVNRVLFLQSQYDLFQLQDLGIIDPTAVDRFEDDASFAQAALNFIENYGQQIRASIEETARTVTQSVDSFQASFEGTVFSFFSTACGQHGYIVPTAIHSIEARTEQVGEVGSIRFQRDEAAWKAITLNTFSIRDVIELFITNQTLTKVVTDNCGEFLCNEGCLTQILPFTVTALVDVCLQQLVFVYAFFLLFILIFFFFLSWVRIRQWRTSCRKFWKKVKQVEQRQMEQAETERTSQKLPQTESKRFGLVGKEMTRTKSRTTQKERARDEEEEQFEFLKSIAVQRNQSADEVQKQLIVETNVDAEYRRVHLMMENVSYWAPRRITSLKDRICKRNAGKHILRNVSVCFEAGKVHAIMGPSGSGKSTLMELISLSKTSGRMSGSMYINGVATNAKISGFLKTWLKRNQSYVTQQDVFFPMLTVREHLEHCAWLILPEYMPDSMKLNRVWQMIRLLDLTSCADTICGDGGVAVEGGISGGQRRRLSVASQLLLNPCVLFLDEPTSGLDSVSALNLVHRLQLFAKKAGMNVIMTIHQPRREIYSEIDKLYILLKGRMIFSGNVKDTKAYFGLDAANHKLNVGNEILDVLKDIKAEVDSYILKYKKTNNYNLLMEEIQKEKSYLSAEVASEIREVLVFNSLAEGRFSWRRPSTVFSLQWVLLSRTFKRGGFNLLQSFFLSSLAGILLGSLFFQSDQYESIVSLLYLCVATLTFLQGVFLGRRYFDEKDMYDYEFRTGVMKSWEAFLFAQFSRDAVTSVVESLAFSIPLYFLTGLSLDAERILNFIILVMLIGYATTCQNVLIQIDRNETRSAATIQIGLLGLGALFNGFIINLEDLPVYYSFLPYLLLNFYGFVGVLINQLGNFSLPCDLSVLECATRTGDIVIQSLQYDHIDVFISVVALMVIILITRTFGALDFYLRFAREGHVKKIGVDGVSRPIRSHQTPQLLEAREGKATTGQTLQNVMAANTASRLAANLPKTQNGSSAISDINPSVDPLGIIPAGDTATEAVNLQRAPSQGVQQSQRDLSPPVDEAVNLPLRVASNTEEGDVIDEEAYDDMSYYDDDDSGGIEKKGLVGLLLSRYFIALIFVADLATTGYVCAYDGSIEVVLTGVAVGIVLIYFLHFIFQIGFLIPFTFDNSGREFTWAAWLDGWSFGLLLLDLSFAFLQFQATNDLFVRQGITISTKVVRLIRVVLYFKKSSAAHRLRAESFLEARKQVLLKSIAELNSTVALPTPVVQSANWLANMAQNVPESKPSVMTSPTSPTRPTRPPRPVRPTRPRQGSFKASMNSSGRKSMGFSIGNNVLVQQQFSRLQHAYGQPGTRTSVGSGANLRSVTRSQGRGRGRAGSQFSLQQGWQKYRNDQTGQTIYFNPFTGEYVNADATDSQMTV